MTPNPGPVDYVPDLSVSIRDLGEWLISLSQVLDAMGQTQRRELQRACRGLRRDLHALNIPVPERRAGQ